MSARLDRPPPSAPGALAPAQASALAASPSWLERWVQLSLQVALDALAINVAFVLSYVARYRLEIGGEVQPVNFVPLSSYGRTQLAWTAILLVFFAFYGLYRRRRGSGWLDKVFTIAQAATLGYVALNAISYLFRVSQESRLMYVYVWGGTIAILGVVKMAEAGWRTWARSRGRGVDRLLMVGGSDTAKMLMQHVANQPGLGYELVGFVDDEAATQGSNFGRFQVLGGLGQLPRVVREQGVSEVIVCLPGASHQTMWSVITSCDRLGVSYKVVPDLFEMSVSRVDVNTIAGIPLIAFKEVSIHGWNRFVKRVVDVAVAAGVLVGLLPLWLLVALAVKLDSPGPVLFRQTRVGRGGLPFTLYKFRSMHVGADQRWRELLQWNEADGPIFKMRNDPRLTHVGRVIRRFSLDEVPQFLNVLRGEMSVVGPRPPLPDEVERYQEWHMRRLDVEGGITGLWQVSGRSHLSFDEMVMLDIYYIENWSLTLDFKIMLRTIPAVVSTRGSF